MKRSRILLALLTVLGWSSSARAATVAITSPPSPSPALIEAVILLRGELLSVGLEVTLESPSPDHHGPGQDSWRWLADLAVRGASAVVDAVEVEAGLAVDVWVVKTQPLRFEVTRVAVDADTPKASEVLALRAVEALRAGLFLVDRAARRQRSEPTTPGPALGVSAGAGGGPEQRAERLAVDAGAAAVASLDGVDPAILPMLRVSWAIRGGLLAQASLLGAGMRPTVATADGSARVAQSCAALGVGYRLRMRERLWPFFGLAAGALHTSVEGQTGALTQGRTVDQWSFLVEGSVGAGLRLYGRFYLTLAAHVQWAAPYVTIHIADAIGATTGRPNLVLSLTVGAWL